MTRAKTDVVDRITAQWRETRPDLDISPVALIGRVSRLSRYVDRVLAENFARHDLENWMYDVLAALYRGGEPYELGAGELVRHTMVTTGAITHRLDRLEALGLLERAPSPGDRRRVVVRLTAEGRARMEEVAPTHLETEERILAALSPSARAQVVRSLRKVLLALGDAVEEPE